MNTQMSKLNLWIILMLALCSFAFALSTTDADLLVYLSDTNATHWIDTKANNIPLFPFKLNGDASVSTTKLSPFGTDKISISGNAGSKFNNTDLPDYIDKVTTLRGLTMMFYLGAQQIREDRIIIGAVETSAPAHGFRWYGRSNVGNTLFGVGYESDGTLLFDFSEEGANFVDNNNYCVVLLINNSGVQMYVNNSLKETGAMSATTAFSMSDVSMFNIGEADGIALSPMIFSMSDFAIYNRSISVAEISSYCSNGITSPVVYGAPSAPIVYLPNGTANLNTPVKVAYNASVAQGTNTMVYYSVKLLTKNGTFVSTISANNSLNLNITFNATAYNGEYKINVTAYDNMGLSNYSFSNNFTIDNTLPQIVLTSPALDNSTIFYNISTTISLTALFTDNNALYDYSFNISDCITNKYSNSTTISGTSYLFNASVYIKNWSVGSYCGNVRLCDAHTASEINPALKVGKAYNALNFTFPDTAIKISTTSPDAISTGYEKLKDRYSFEFTYSSKIAERTYMLESDKKIIYLKESPYKGHFVVDNRYWVDFEPYDVTVYESSGIWYIITRNSAVSEKFFSIGELNCINTEFTFEIRTLPSDSAYSINILKWTNWFNFDALNTNTTAGVLLIFFLLAVLIALITLSESVKIPFFALLSAIYGIFFGMLVFTVISAVLGVIVVILSAGYIIRSLLMVN